MGGPPAFDRGVTATHGGTQYPTGRLQETARQAVDGRLRVPIGATYAFSDASAAILDFAAQHVRGKYVVTL
jgi:NADPH:quinone reductase-like Zn-dependent oxidoreductase